MAVSHAFTNAVPDMTGTITVFNSQGCTTSAIATNIVRPSDWNSGHNQYYTLSGNTTGASTASGQNVVWSAAGAAITLAGSTGSIIVSSPPHVSLLEQPAGGPIGVNIISTNSNSVSWAIGFNLKQPVSAAFLRIPVVMTQSNTTVATTGASMSASVQLQGTFNAVIYSLGTGASSRSLISVASGSAGSTFMNSISVAANGTQYSITQAVTLPVEGTTTGFTTQNSRSTSNYSFDSTAGVFTNCSGNRFLDIPFANSLPAGAYWLLFGQSTSLATNSTGMSAASGANVRHGGSCGVASQINSNFGIMGSTNLTSGGLLSAGSFSTAGGGTTSAFPMSAISSSASNPQLYFQLIRSA